MHWAFSLLTLLCFSISTRSNTDFLEQSPTCLGIQTTTPPLECCAYRPSSITTADATSFHVSNRPSTTLPCYVFSGMTSSKATTSSFRHITSSPRWSVLMLRSMDYDLDRNSPVVQAKLVKLESTRSSMSAHDHRALQQLSGSYYLKPFEWVYKLSDFRIQTQIFASQLFHTTSRERKRYIRKLRKLCSPEHSPFRPRLVGGSCERRKKSVYDSSEFSTLLTSCASPQHVNIELGETFAFQDFLSTDVASASFSSRTDHLVVSFPLRLFSSRLKQVDLKRVIKSHGGFKVKAKDPVAVYQNLLRDHDSTSCSVCPNMSFVFRKHQPDARLVLIDYLPAPDVSRSYLSHSHLSKSLPLPDLESRFDLTLEQYKMIAAKHGNLGVHAKDGLSSFRSVFKTHSQCRLCNMHSAVWAHRRSTSDLAHESTQSSDLKTEDTLMADVDDTQFPPRNIHNSWIPAIRGFCEAMSPKSIEETGCTVCGQLVLKTLSISKAKCNLKPLKSQGDGYTRVQRLRARDKIKEVESEILVEGLGSVCLDCNAYLEREKIPPAAVANGLWLGEVPEQLKGLSFAEKLVVARVRYNRCVAHVSVNGVKNNKMRGNAMLFQNPTPQLYAKLPPRISSLDEVLAITFAGPVEYSADDLARTPLLVRRKKISDALEWLKLNHCDYFDLEIDHDALNEYPEQGCPVTVRYCKTSAGSESTPEATSFHNSEGHEGTTSGSCPFAVHGLTGQELGDMKSFEIKARALAHMNYGSTLLVRHGSQGESLYDNPQLYPKVFPWLFPYGLGGVGTKATRRLGGQKAHKRWLMMYHDKRFQTDPYFPLIALNHTQIKEASNGGFVLTKRRNFSQIANRALSLDPYALSQLAQRLQYSTGKVVAENDNEKQCYNVLSDLEIIADGVTGSLSTKKQRRLEAWSLMKYVGAPSWFITFAPADVRHPLSIYYAKDNITFQPKFEDKNEVLNLISQNPAAAARFFDFTVKMFIKDVLGVGSEHSGVFGDTLAYYGTVEEQGRLTLHLHLLLWIKGALSPQMIREKMLSKDSEFQKAMIAYLEACHQGELFGTTCDDLRNELKKHTPTGEVVNVVKDQSNSNDHSMNDINQLVDILTSDNKTPSSHVDTKEYIPEAPPTVDGACNSERLQSWWSQFKVSVNKVVATSNWHECSKPWSTCRIKGKGVCAARFPRTVVDKTEIDTETGGIMMRHKEQWMNTFNAPLSYLLHCNTDVTSLLSGTAIKAVIAYITDYTTKSKLKTYAIFQTLRSTIEKNQELLTGGASQDDKAKRLLTKMVNQLTAKMEIGAPLACMYLLGMNDWYSSHEFRSFYWAKYQSFVFGEKERVEVDPDSDEAVRFVRTKAGDLKPVNGVDDYVYRPEYYVNMTLYDWARRSCKVYDKRQAKNSTADTEFELDLLEVEPQEEPTIYPSTDTVNRKLLRQFLVGHPQVDTHRIQMSPDRSNLVPVFMGPPLPRRDAENHDYYYSTMLTFFVPWRSPKDVKADNETWTEAFERRSFSARQKEIMDFFHLQYECLDARDDYHQKRKSQLREMRHGPPEGLFMDEFEIKQQIDENSFQNYLPEEDGDGVEPEEWGRKFLIRTSKMSLIESLMKSVGWTMRPTKTSCVPESTVSMNERGPQFWKKVVDTAKETIIKLRRSSNSSATQTRDELHTVSLDGNGLESSNGWAEIKLCSEVYMNNQTFASGDDAHDKLVDLIVAEMTYNVEQERAFRIVSNHVALGKGPEQLMMILSGMAGTGKSRVITGVVKLFDGKGQRHRLLLVAPTGAAASIIGGSTYHSALGIYGSELDGPKESAAGGFSSSSNQNSRLMELRSDLVGTDYLILDEYSMLGVRNLYKISERCCKIFGMNDKPFGGINVIFAGDFAQLAPVLAVTLYNRTVGVSLKSGMTAVDQMNTIGKSLWHQFTTVVILRQNMRQNGQSAADKKLRTALENMRYAACTKKDIDFLRTLCISDIESDPRFQSDKFRNVSIITRRNASRDKINMMGAVRFSNDTKQSLREFYSEDKVPKKAKRSSPYQPAQCGKPINERTQRRIWSLPPDATSQHASCLSLCIGMPVLLKRNQATECGITNGAEGVVVGWECGNGHYDQSVLKTLFVRLLNPNEDIQVEDLPKNVVPVISQKIDSVECSMQDDTVINIDRDQVPVLLNFAMTDYAAQGRTRPCNVVHLADCDSHNSYYVCLSRSASAKDTIIIGDIEPKYITGGASSQLRQEFRVLEILDEVTKFRFEGKLVVDGGFATRGDAVAAYNRHNNNSLVCPPHVHSSISWSHSDPVLTDKEWKAAWRVVESSKPAKVLKAVKAGVSNHQPTTSGPLSCDLPPTSLHEPELQMDLTDPDEFDTSTSSNTLALQLQPESLDSSKYYDQDFDHDTGVIDLVSDNHLSCQTHPSSLVTHENSIHILVTPLGLKWNNNSCAYDALVAILYHVFQRDPHKWLGEASACTGDNVKLLGQLLNLVSNGSSSLEFARDQLAHVLHQKSPSNIPEPGRYTSLTNIFETIFTSNTHFIRETVSCLQCGWIAPNANSDMCTSVFMFNNSQWDVYRKALPDLPPLGATSVAEWIKTTLRCSSVSRTRKCLKCRLAMFKKRQVNRFPSVLFIDMQNLVSPIKIEAQFSLRSGHLSAHYELCGIAYFGGAHFTCRIIDARQQVWAHDSLWTSQDCQNQGAFSCFDKAKLWTLRDSRAVGLVYTLNYNQSNTL